MNLADIFKKGRRKLVKSESHKAPPRTTSPLPDLGLQITNAAQVPTTTPSILASPPLIPRPVSAPPEMGDAEASGFNNDSWPNLTTLLGLLDQSVLLSPLKAVLDELNSFVRFYESAVTARTEIEALRAQLEVLFKDLCGHFTGNVPPLMTVSMLNLCGAIQTELRNLDGNHDRNTISRYFQANCDLDEITASYRRIQGYLERLMLNANLSMWAVMDKQATEIQLAKLTPSLSASYNSAEATLVRRRECTSKTREQVLLDLKAWKSDRNGEKVCWMSGMAGTGKITIAMTLCSTLDGGHELGASFFCNRSLPECRNVKLIWPTIAYQLARFSIPFQGALNQVLERDPDVHTKALRAQFKHMILEPLQHTIHALPTSVVVIIDALDECEDDGGAEQILDVLLEHASKLPIKFFASSRPEPYIRERIGKSAQTSHLILHELDEKMVTADIGTYLREELISILFMDDQLETLVKHAGVLFIYAATVARYIKSGNSQKRLATVLEVSGPGRSSSNKTKQIDALYEAVLASALSNSDLEDSEKEQMKLVLHTVVCAQEPLTVDALARLLKLSSTEVQEALRPLWSVLHVSESGTTNRVSILHASFSNYILDFSRSKQFACDAETHNGKLANLCFKRIEQNQPQFNICNLVSSYVFDKDIPNLDDIINQAIPLDLLYACQYWVVHLNLGHKSNTQAQILHDFLSKRLLCG
ncbi:unnamed protein product [Rhizoctonia solani]|uniref:Nephrocystin 3-like N-terminal domain-containing protein n=1 Tax=Rhizoctonia solani TaxID=456999 RepID=A0A8H3CUN9_9AGAM|nr:unnamed protein product [Rhizoctonia solani]